MLEEKAFSDRRARLSPTKQALLEKWTRGECTIEEHVIPKRPKESTVPLSFSQQRLWFIDQLIPGSPAYNCGDAVRLKGQVNVEVLQKCINEIVSRHEVLRTVFPSVDGQSFQVVSPSLELPLQVIDLEEYGEEEREAHALRIAEKVELAPFNLARGPVLRAALLHLDKEDYIFLVVMHHIVTDGWSYGVFMRELSVLYKAFSRGEPSPFPPLPVQYADFTVWQRHWLQGKRLKDQLNYWMNQLKDSSSVLELPSDRPRPAIQNLKGARESFVLPPSLLEKLKTLGQQEGVTLFMILLAAFKTLLYRYTNQSDILVGMPIANRTRVELEGLIGFFVNTLVLRTDLSNNPDFRELLGRIHKTTIDAYANQDLPFEQVVEKLQPERDMSRNPLFQVMFTHQNWTRPQVEQPPHLTFYPMETRKRVALFDLWFGVWEEEDRLVGAVEYSIDLFDAATIVRVLGHYERLLTNVAANPGQRLWELQFLTKEEQHRLLKEWNQTEKNYPEVLNICEIFASQAEHTPDAVAVVFVDQQLSYSALNARSNQLARYLQRLGVTPDKPVGLCMERSLPMIEGILGILKAGGAYLPIDPQDPPDRILSLLLDSQANILLTRDQVMKNIPFTLLRNVYHLEKDIIVTSSRAQIKDLDELPFPNRSLVDYNKYNRYIGQGSVKKSISIISTRGCPYYCLYCHKLWPKKHVARSAENIFQEIKQQYDRGYSTFGIMDDIFNLDRRNSEAFFEMVVKNNLKIRLMFNSGLRGDLLTPAYIDLMSEAGTISLALALETASPRLQRLIRKNLNIEKLRENILYFCKKHPHIILELFTMFGFPTESEEEALMTLDFVKGIRWLHFPYLNALKIFPNTDMARLAMDQGITREAIENASHLAYHELSDVLPFSKNFARQYQASFMKDYFLDQKRLENVIPSQKKILTREELIAKYDSYLPGGLEGYPEIKQLIDSGGCYQDDIPLQQESGADIGSITPTDTGGLRLLLLDLSKHFSPEAAKIYNVVEVPLGLMYLLTYVKREFKDKIQGKILKSMVDFDSFAELKRFINDFQPQIIGIRTLSLYKDFFHKTASLIKQWLPGISIITGGPYATSEYPSILSDANIDVVVLGEGEITFAHLLGKILENQGKLPGDDVLKQIPGLAFVPRAVTAKTASTARKVLLVDEIQEEIARESHCNPQTGVPDSGANLAYVIYTSGSTGTPKGVLNTHRGIFNRLWWMQETYQLNESDRVLQKTPYTFDVSVWEFLWPLLKGACLVIARPEGHKDCTYLVNKIIKEKITTLHFVPSMLEVFLEAKEVDKCTSLRRVISSGEALPFSLQERFFASLDAGLHNLYGPTEAAVDVTSWACQRENQLYQTVPIGRPIANIRIYLLDPYRNPVPVGVPGELHISGIGLARGYLNQPGLTQKQFIFHSPGGTRAVRLYKTGDLARYFPEGNIEFLGRLDHQVKIRGLRIELGEIEAVLRQHSSVRDAVVLARDTESGSQHKHLVAYIIPHEPAQNAETSLPEGQWAQERLAEWQQVFDKTYIETAHVQDPTFNIVGWNSSYTNQPLTNEEMREWVDYTVQRIADLKPKRVLEIGCGTGLLLFRLAPSCEQYWGTDFSASALHYIHQQMAALEYELPQVKLFQQEANNLSGLDTGAFDMVIFNSVVQYFPAIDYLKRVLEDIIPLLRPGGSIFVGDVRNLSLLEAFHTSVGLAHSSSSLSTAALRQQVQEKINRERELIIHPAFFYALQDELPHITAVKVFLKQGTYHNELTQFRYDVILSLGQEQPRPETRISRLNWQEAQLTFAKVCQQLMETSPDILVVTHIPNNRLQKINRTLALLAGPDCPDTIANLEQALQQMPPTESPDPEEWWTLSEELPYLVEVIWPEDSVDGCYDVVLKHSHLAEEKNRPLSPHRLREKPAENHRWYSFANNPLKDMFDNQLVSNLQSHLLGRLPKYTMPSAFVFMEAWPLTPSGKLDRQALLSPAKTTLETKENFMEPRTPIEKELVEIWSQVLGLEQVGINNNFFELGGDSILSIRVVTRANRANIQMTPQQLFQHQTIAELAEIVSSSRDGDVDRDQQTTPGSLVNPPDRTRINQLLHTPGIEDIYPLGPFQEYLLDLYLSNPGEGLHLVQRVDNLNIPLNIPALENAWKQLVQTHAILRTSFTWEGLSMPYQVVHQNADTPLEFQDWCGLSPSQQQERLKAFLEANRSRGIEPAKPKAGRLLVIQVAEEEYQVVLNFSYLCLDGWSLNLLSNQLFELHEAICRGKDLQPEPGATYRDYISWFKQQDLYQPGVFWRNYLKGFTSPTRLSRVQENSEPQENSFGCQHVYLSSSITAGLQAFGREYQLTPNSIVQAAWSLLLGLYTGQEDIVFGIAVSGRIPTLANIDTILGTTLNILPLRVQISSEIPLLHLTKQLMTQQMELSKYEFTPLRKIRQWSEISPDLPLFEHYLVFQNITPSFDNQVGIPPIMYLKTGHPLRVDIFPGTEIGLNMMYYQNYFDDQTITRMLGHFKTLLEAIALNPGCTPVQLMSAVKINHEEHKGHEF